eukprot:4470491-Prymnesium_polylepis.1
MCPYQVPSSCCTPFVSTFSTVPLRSLYMGTSEVSPVGSVKAAPGASDTKRFRQPEIVHSSDSASGHRAGSGSRTKMLPSGAHTLRPGMKQLRFQRMVSLESAAHSACR